MSSNTTIKSDETLFSIIELLRELDGAGVSELAHHLDVAKSTVHKHLKTLEKHQYVTNDDGFYNLSFKFLSHGEYVRERSNLCRLGREKVRELGDKTDFLAMFTMMEFDRGVFVYVYNDRLGLRQTSQLGQQFYLHTNAAGKAMLAQLSDDDVRRIVETTGLPSRTSATITDRDVLFDQIELIREQGYATSVREWIEGTKAVAAAVHSPERDELGAISLVFPYNPSQKGFREDHTDIISEAGRELELQVKYST